MHNFLSQLHAKFLRIFISSSVARPTQPTIYNCIRHLKAGRQSVMDAQREGEPYEVLGMSKVVLLE